MRILHLYRPRLPSTRAQAIQVLRTAHALATLGHEVTLLADRGRSPEHLWTEMGLGPLPTLNLHVSPFVHSGLAGAWFRWHLKRWWSGPPGVVLARDKRRLLQAIRRHGKRGHRIVLEAHELESAVNPDGARPIEEECLAAADALVTNCGGTLRCWLDAHDVKLPSLVCHNASHIYATESLGIDDHVLILGTMRPFKGVHAVLEAMRRLPYSVQWVGADAGEAVPNHVQLLPAVPHAEIGPRVASARVLLAPLGDNHFGRDITSPLKLWDYLGTTRPIVTARTPATEEIMHASGVPMFLFEPDQIESICTAVTEAWTALPRAPFSRPWRTRAVELDGLFRELRYE